RISELLSLAALALPILALLGYAYGVSHLYGLPLFLPFSGMAVHTATTLLVLAFGVFTARPGGGLMAVVTSARAGGVAARRMLVAFAALPVAALAVILGVRAHLYPEAVGTALVVFVSLLDVLLLMLVSSSHLERKEIALRDALAEAAHWQHFFA